MISFTVRLLYRDDCKVARPDSVSNVMICDAHDTWTFTLYTGVACRPEVRGLRRCGLAAGLYALRFTALARATSVCVCVL